MSHPRQRVSVHHQTRHRQSRHDSSAGDSTMSQPKSVTPTPSHQQRVSVQYQRQRRRLPHVHRHARSRPSTFWPTYRGAVEWLSRNHGILDTALSLLDIYPALIQETPMDGLWDFLAPFLTRATVHRDARTSTPTAPVHRDARTSTPTAPVHRDTRTSTPTAPVHRDTRTSTPTAPVHRDARTCTPTAPVHRDTRTCTPTPPDRGRSGNSSSHHTSTLGTATSKGNPSSPDNGSLAPSGEGATARPGHGSCAGHLPTISVTGAPDEPEPVLHEGDRPMLRKPPCVFVCCHCSHLCHSGLDRLHKHALDALQHDFYVRTGPCGGGQHDWLDGLRQADICVFVLNDSSLNSEACIQILHTASILKVPTVFLKESSFFIPTPLPEKTFKPNLGLMSLAQCLSPKPPPAADSCPGHSATHGVHRRAKTVLSAHSPRTLSVSHGEVMTGRQTSQDLPDCDMTLYLLNGYRNALVLAAESRQQDCEDTLRRKVRSLLRPESCDTRSSQSSSAPTSPSMSQSHSTAGARPVRQTQRSYLSVPNSHSLPDPRASFHKEASDGGGIAGNSKEEAGVVSASPPSVTPAVNVSSVSNSHSDLSSCQTTSDLPPIPCRVQAPPAVSTVLPAVSTVLPAVSTVLPAVSTVLPAVSTVLPAVSTVLPAVSTVLPAVSTVSSMFRSSPPRAPPLNTPIETVYVPSPPASVRPPSTRRTSKPSSYPHQLKGQAQHDRASRPSSPPATTTLAKM